MKSAPWRHQSWGRSCAAHTCDINANNGAHGEQPSFDHLPRLLWFLHILFHRILGTTQIPIVSTLQIRKPDHSKTKTVLRFSLLGKGGIKIDEQSLSEFKDVVIFTAHTVHATWDISAIWVGGTTKQQGKWVNILDINAGSKI